MDFGIAKNPSFKIGSYDEGIMDLEDKVTLKKNKTVNSQQEAVELAKSNPGAEFIVERKNEKGTLSYDVYNMTIHDQGKKIHKLQDAENLTLVDQPINTIEKMTGTKGSIKGYLIAENGDIGKPLYKTQFSTPVYEKIRESVANLRESMGFERNLPWFWLVDTVMGGSAPADDLAPIDSKEIANMKSHLKSGDIIMNGNDGSFIHAIMYVGEDKKLQSDLEKKWELPKGSLNGEGLIIHSLVTDGDTEVEFNGKKQTLKASGEGVNVDTIERYIARHPRDVMLVSRVKDTSEEDIMSAVNEAKKLVGKGYDRSFNTYDDSEMYCTEVVMKAWINSQKSPEFTTQRNPLISYPQFVLDKLPEKLAKSMQDGGMLHQEMIMTDGIATSESTEIVWASQNADKSVFAEKHSRWADGVAGNINDGYKKMLNEDVPHIANRSGAMVEKIKELAARTRAEVGK